MAIVSSQSFRRALLVQAIPLIETFWLRLFVNDHTPAATDTSADYVEPVGGWYAAQRLLQWGPPYITGDHLGRVDEVIRVYTAAAPLADEDVYGYWVSTDNFLFCWAERGPDAPYRMSVAGDKVRVLPRLTSGPMC